MSRTRTAGGFSLNAPFLATVAVLILVAAPVTAQRVSDGTPDFVEPPTPPEGTSRVTFYGYVFASSLGSPMPANTQFPWGVADWGSSLVDAPINCGPAPLDDCDTYDINKIVLFTTAGPVQVKSTAEFAYDKLHNENGMSQDVQLDTTQSVTATLFMSAAAHAWPHNEDETPCMARDPPQSVPCWQPYWRWHSGVNPNVVVRASLYGMKLGTHGADADRAPPIESELANGTALLVAVGETKPTLLVSADGAGGNERVWRFDVDLGAPLVETVPRDMNLVLVYSWHNVLPDGSKVGFSSPPRINTGEFFPTQFSVPVKNAFSIELVAPQSIHEKVAIITVMNTPWGSYDVDPKSVKIEVLDPSGGALDTEGIRAFADYQVAHGAHYKPINTTFVWDHKALDLRPGVYTIQVSACNFQRSACDSVDAKVEFGAGGTVVGTEPGIGRARTFSDEDLAQFQSGAPQSSGGAVEFLALDLAEPPETAAAPLSSGAAASAPAATRDVPLPFLAPLALGLALLLRRRTE